MTPRERANAITQLVQDEIDTHARLGDERAAVVLTGLLARLGSTLSDLTTSDIPALRIELDSETKRCESLLAALKERTSERDEARAQAKYERDRAEGNYEGLESAIDRADAADRRNAELEAALRIGADALTSIGSGHTIDRYGADAHVKKRGCGCRDIYQGANVTFVPCRAHEVIDAALSPAPAQPANRCQECDSDLSEYSHKPSCTRATAGLTIPMDAQPATAEDKPEGSCEKCSHELANHCNTGCVVLGCRCLETIGMPPSGWDEIKHRAATRSAMPSPAARKTTCNNRMHHDGYMQLQEHCNHCLSEREWIEPFVLLKNGGEWLGAARKWLQWNARNGSAVAWSSGDKIEPQMTVKQVEELAAHVAAAVMNSSAVISSTRPVEQAARDYVRFMKAPLVVGGKVEDLFDALCRSVGEEPPCRNCGGDTYGAAHHHWCDAAREGK